VLQSVQEARRVTGLFGDRAIRHGLRFGGSLDQLADALRTTGLPVTYEPVENALSTPRAIGGFRTWGSPWTDAQEPRRGAVLTVDLARSLSKAPGYQVLIYDYDFTRGCFHHAMYAGGSCLEEWHDERAVCGEGERHIDARLRLWKMRDWGIDLQDLQSRRLPFPPAIMMEAYVLSLDGSGSRLWAV
jgi:hypothetical protein